MLGVKDETGINQQFLTHSFGFSDTPQATMVATFSLALGTQMLYQS